MAKPLNEEISTNIKELIGRITHHEVGSAEFNSVEKCVITTLKKSDTMYFLNTKDIRTAIWSMAEKFMFHGFFKHADHLRQAHDRYIDRNLSESDLTPRLNVVKFLLCMSESPTTHFWKHPDRFEFIQEQPAEEEVVDWGAYLNEGIERWSPAKDDSFDLTDSGDESVRSPSPELQTRSSTRAAIAEAREFKEYDFRASRSELIDTVQNGWYNGGVVLMEPPSEWFDASVGILWERHLQNQVRDLIQIEPITVISEYKVMREVLWQMWGPHSSTVFELSINKLVPKTNVTISSICSMTFENFMQVFVPYVELLYEFRLFYRELEGEGVPETYKSYGQALQKITRPVLQQLIEIEMEVRKQESTMTLLKLAGKLEAIFEPIKILKIVHQEVIKDFKCNSSLDCVLTLLTRLRRSLQFPLNQLEQDIRLTLYLESLYYYFTIINAWLVKNDLSDYTEEFVILNKNEKNSSKILDNCHMNFILQDNMEEFVKSDGMIKIICDQVLQIGRNIHLLRLLDKYDVFTKGSETIHQEFIRRILDELCAFYGRVIPEPVSQEVKLQKFVSNFDLHEMGDWTNFVDLSDGFLTKAFDGFYLEMAEEPDLEPSLFEKINNITETLFPVQGLPERVFGEILRERFTISGLMVKNLLIENYGLDKQFEFLNHIFLFNDDLIFPFYRRLFEKMNIENSNWGNSVWLTSHLQDIIMDLYPNFYEDCTVQVEIHWRQCRDSLEACALLCLQYEIKWPLNIIITREHTEMYRDLFRFILKLKWALYTMNHLSFLGKSIWGSSGSSISI
ncbi:Spc97 Spc98 domain containing protein [Asbolus verrucosus]|uniref:Spc97 Spc98 domain containing protein n=1 Tax=Asbolus verrucosus TaxID=1661398 RepID=A0A482VUU4_ASBVE|nr:Spc97 Spc98 domain containing protein [Asbolus verrucosus]